MLSEGIVTCKRIAVLSALAAGLLLPGGCNKPADDHAAQGLTSLTAKGDAGVRVKELTDANNPYRGQYAAWDEWTYANAHSSPAALEGGEMPEGFGSLRGVIDPAGYLVPHLEYVRGGEAALANGTQREYYSRFTTIYGEGPLDPELETERFAAESRLKAAYYPAIPDWLAADPPFKAMLFPNGDVITLGEPGDYARFLAEGESCCPVAALCRYSAAGELISKLKEYESWWQLYYEPPDGIMPEGKYSVRQDGYVVFTDQLSGTVLSIWDYDGARLNTTVLPPVRDAHGFTWIAAEKLKKYHEYQQEAAAPATTQ